MVQPDPGQSDSTGLAAPLIREERRRARRTKLALRARLQPYNHSAHIPEEIRPTVNVSRDGLYFTTKRSSYTVHLHLYVACPYLESQPDREREVARVVRVESQPDGQWGVAVLFVRSICFHRSTAFTSETNEAR